MNEIKIDNISKLKVTLEGDGLVGFTYKAKVDLPQLMDLAQLVNAGNLHVTIGSNQIPLPMNESPTNGHQTALNIPAGGIGPGETTETDQTAHFPVGCSPLSPTGVVLMGGEEEEGEAVADCDIDSMETATEIAQRQLHIHVELDDLHPDPKEVSCETCGNITPFEGWGAVCELCGNDSWVLFESNGTGEESCITHWEDEPIEVE